jgi:hypothetical protein
MAPLLCGFVGALVGALWGYKGEWPAVTIMVFASLGFALLYGLAVGVTLKSLGGV